MTDDPGADLLRRARQFIQALPHAKALGMELRPLLPGGRLIVVDEVSLADGDYLDLGMPLREGGFVPLVIKSLAFSGEKGG